MIFKRIVVALCLLATAPLAGLVDSGVQAKVKFGARGGVNVTSMSFSSDMFDSSNRTGFYVGPTMKIGLGLIGFDASLLYNQIESKSIYREGDAYIDYPSLVRKSISLPVNLRFNFGIGDKLGIFIFGGPQADLYVGGDSDYDDIGKMDWKQLAISINAGAGVMLMKHLELRANYSIPCGSAGEFSWNGTQNGVPAKSGVWQIGVAVYF